MRITAIAAGLVVMSAGAARAQTDHAHLGVHGLYSSTFGDWGFGAQASAPIAHHLEFYPSFDYYIQTPGSIWEINADLKYRLLGAHFEWIYIGSGVNYDRTNEFGFDKGTVGWNMLAGAESIRGQVHPYAEMRATVTDHTRFQVEAGLNVTLGKHEHR